MLKINPFDHPENFQSYCGTEGKLNPLHAFLLVISIIFYLFSKQLFSRTCLVDECFCNLLIFLKKIHNYSIVS